MKKYFAYAYDEDGVLTCCYCMLLDAQAVEPPYQYFQERLPLVVLPTTRCERCDEACGRPAAQRSARLIRYSLEANRPRRPYRKTKNPKSRKGV